VNVPAEPTVNVAAAAVVIEGASLTISVNAWTAAGAMLLRAVMSKS
jgi:hypothetical protein